MMAIVSPPDEALRWNERAMAFAEKSSDPKAQGWIGSLLNNIGWTYYDTGDYAKALEGFERDRAWYSARNLDELPAIARYSLGKTLRVLARLDESLAIQRELMKALPDDGYVQEEIAECLLVLGKPGEARPHFARADELLSKDPSLA